MTIYIIQKGRKHCIHGTDVQYSVPSLKTLKYIRCHKDMETIDKLVIHMFSNKRLKPPILGSKSPRHCVTRRSVTAHLIYQITRTVKIPMSGLKRGHYSDY